MTSSLVVGLFVGGRGSRMGGVAKGNLKAPASTLTLLERLRLEIRAAAPTAEIVLVGDAASYARLGLLALPDDPPRVGPLGGLAALLSYAEQRGAPHALALACDLPRLGRALIERMLLEAPAAAAVVARQGAVRNPLIARYAVAPSRPALRDALSAGQRSLQAVLDRLEPNVASPVLALEEQAQLDDWDTTTDVSRG